MPTDYKKPFFTPDALQFFRALKRNNRREWFQPRKDQFDAKVRTPMLDLIGALMGSMRKYAPDHVPSEPKDALYRIYRDTRFSKDKTPYKTHIAATFSRGGMEKHGSAGYYFSVGHDGVEVAGGLYMPEREALLAVRTHLAKQFSQFRSLSNNRKLVALMGEMQGSALTRVPKGFPADHPAADLLRRKQWLYYVTLDPELATSPGLFGELDARFRALAPFVEWLNAPLLASRRARTSDYF